MRNEETKKYFNSLKKLDLPNDLKKMSILQLNDLCYQIRKILVSTVSQTGGHLSSNLGVVELTVAMHKVFSCPDDKFVWDVGHQGYTHKILTGRLDEFKNLRKENGISGFIKPSESDYDAFISGHASNSISAALGIATALIDENNYTLAVIGDGAFSGGLAYEGLNNAGKSNAKLIVILNQNDMSISKNVGAFSKYLTDLRTRQSYLKTKFTVSKALSSTPLVGKSLKKILSLSKDTVKNAIIDTNFFEDFGFQFVGPVDGHNIEELINALSNAKAMNRPVVVNVHTVKGMGFTPAEENPSAFHGVGRFNIKSGEIEKASANSYSNEFGKIITELACKDEKIYAITAAMKYGTGLQGFAKKHKDRFFDVGIAESHAVTFAGGLAKMGKIPIFCVYSTFLQRAYDQILHDIAIDNLHFVIGIDRAGIVGDDGETHQGMFDVGFLTSIPNVILYAPSNFYELKKCICKAIYLDSGVVGVRYPKGEENCHIDNKNCDENYELIQNNSDVLVISYGRVLNEVFEAKKILKLQTKFDILKLVKIYPFEQNIANLFKNYKKVVFFEEGYKNGGIAEKMMVFAYENGYSGQFLIVALEDFVKQSTVASALEKHNLSSNSIAKFILENAKK